MSKQGTQRKDSAQAKRLEAAREAECSEDETEILETVKRIAATRGTRSVPNKDSDK
jgi:hypothetical protein